MVEGKRYGNWTVLPLIDLSDLYSMSKWDRTQKITCKNQFYGCWSLTTYMIRFYKWWLEVIKNNEFSSMLTLEENRQAVQITKIVKLLRLLTSVFNSCNFGFHNHPWFWEYSLVKSSQLQVSDCFFLYVYYFTCNQS